MNKDQFIKLCKRIIKLERMLDDFFIDYINLDPKTEIKKDLYYKHSELLEKSLESLQNELSTNQKSSEWYVDIMEASFDN
jgi:hypothetical protein